MTNPVLCLFVRDSTSLSPSGNSLFVMCQVLFSCSVKWPLQSLWFRQFTSAYKSSCCRWLEKRSYWSSGWILGILWGRFNSAVGYSDRVLIIKTAMSKRGTERRHQVKDSGNGVRSLRKKKETIMANSKPVAKRVPMIRVDNSSKVVCEYGADTPRLR